MTAGEALCSVLWIVKCHPILGQSIQKFLHKCPSPGVLVTSFCGHIIIRSGSSALPWLTDIRRFAVWAQPRGIAGACHWGMITNGNTRDQRTGNSQWNPNPSSVCWAFESRRKVNIVLLASQTHELSAAERRVDPVMCYRSCIPPSLCSGAVWRIYKCPCGKPIAGGGGNMRPGGGRRGGYSSEQERCTGGCWDYIDWSVTLAPSYYSLWHSRPCRLINICLTLNLVHLKVSMTLQCVPHQWPRPHSHITRITPLLSLRPVEGNLCRVTCWTPHQHVSYFSNSH